jgi:glyceraldehyde 3-phosphate dehydrogenase
MNKLKVGINGFGRIGRAILRINALKNNFKIVAINDINPDTENLAYLLNYDSQYGRFSGEIGVNNDSEMIVNGNLIKVFHEAIISNVPWDDMDVDVVIDASGIQNNVIESRNCLRGSVKNVIITHTPPVSDIDFSFVFGVNDDGFDYKRHKIISSSICDVIAFTPVAKNIEMHFGIKHVFITTLHPWLQYQNLLDGPSASVRYPGATYHAYVLGRASTNSLIPKPTTVGSASLYVLPFLKDKISCYSFRVPIGHVSSADLTFELGKKVTKEVINDLFKELANKNNKVFGYNEEPLVSMDFAQTEQSVIVDGRWTNVLNDRYLKLVIWYDNEWGYSSKVVDTVEFIGDKK